MDSIWVIVDILTKFAHFLPVRTVYNADRLVTVYINEIIQLHDVPVSIVLDRDSKFITTKNIQIIQQRLKIAQSRQKRYADQRRRDLEFEVGDYVFIKVTLMKGQTRFGKKGKLSPRYIGPFQILERLGHVAYQIDLPPGMEQVHNVFHVSMLRGYLRDPFHVINYHQIVLDDDMVYEEKPVRILDRQVKQLRNKTIPMVKFEWKEHYGKKATWE
ncbi:uncharacterized protein LOC114265041 [Camellia sinensis]|uniref:uncharacterized protein LOC114265041 n=1 Tax=Camellia sinensis TaxID=4442 RepID=UPI001035D93E|nr:uncharacterized protein LOC114265041 [Camellia sinensis]